MAEEQIVQYGDFSAFGELDPRGQIVILKNHSAVANALAVWIGSRRGDYIGYPDRGGYVLKWLMKPLGDATARRIRESIQEGLLEEFTPRIKIRELTVDPLYDRQEYRLYVTGYAPEVQQAVKLEANLRKLPAQN